MSLSLAVFYWVIFKKSQNITLTYSLENQKLLSEAEDDNLIWSRPRGAWIVPIAPKFNPCEMLLGFEQFISTRNSILWYWYNLYGYVLP